MDIYRVIFLILLSLGWGGCRAAVVVVADSLTREPLVNASVFGKFGNYLGLSDMQGRIACASSADYPLTLRYMGFKEIVLNQPGADSVFMQESFDELPEVVIESRQAKMLHVFAYVREYSTLATYTDTVTLFREKMVDFMLPYDYRSRYRGWRLPRIIKSKSYYRFSNAAGLDSVSDRCNNHFTWTDWIGILPTISEPLALSEPVGRDTLHGKYSPYEIWSRKNGRVAVDIDVLADTAARRWVPEISRFFDNEKTDFEQFRLRVNYSDASKGELLPIDLNSYSFLIESRGRGHDMFRFNRHYEPFFVSTYAEVYILDREFVTTKEAKIWSAGGCDARDIDIIVPQDAPQLQAPVAELIARVEAIDEQQVRLSQRHDYSYAYRPKIKRNIGYRALGILKNITGIGSAIAKRKWKKNWHKFSRQQIQTNNRRRAEADSIEAARADSSAVKK